MIFIVNATNRLRFAADLLQMHRHRKAAFVDVLGWDIPVVDDFEIDRYDQDDTTYLIAKREAHGSVLASVRLLPTVKAHLMIDLFRDACLGNAPRGPQIWEVSRFCASPAVRSRRDRVQLFGEIVCGVMETAMAHHVKRVTFSANTALLPISLACGWDAQRLGPTLPDGNDRLTAVSAAIDEQGLRRVRHRFGIAGPVVQLPSASVRDQDVNDDPADAASNIDPTATEARRPPASPLGSQLSAS